MECKPLPLDWESKFLEELDKFGYEHPGEAVMAFAAEFIRDGLNYFPTLYTMTLHGLITKKQEVDYEE